MNKKYNYITYIGRFEPFHNGHMPNIKTALNMADKVIVVLGSHNSPRTCKNPWNTSERQLMIRSCFSISDNQNIEFLPVEDRLYQNTEWLSLVREGVANIALTHGATSPKIAIIGHDKDETSFYIREFPDWEVIETDAYVKGYKGVPISATKIRELMFTGHVGYVESNVPPPVYSFLTKFMETPEAEAIKLEFDAYVKEEKSYENSPYHTNFYTADPVVFQSNHVLLVKRKKMPGANLWALPGGHVEPTETSFEAAIRELYEESNIKVPRAKLVGSMKIKELFEHPDRSLRCRISKPKGRTVTVAYCFDLDGVQSSGDPVSKLPKVSPSKEVLEARWFPLNEIKNMRNIMFEDHPDIIEYFVSKLPMKTFSSW